MTNFQELRSDEKAYLLNKWNTEIIELSNDRSRALDRLNIRVTRQEVNIQELDKLKADLEDARSLATYLESTGAIQEWVDKQNARVAELEQEVFAKSASNRVLTRTDISMEELEIEELQVRVQLRRDRIAALEALNLAA
jgi:hypothetical protein